MVVSVRVTLRRFVLLNIVQFALSRLRCLRVGVKRNVYDDNTVTQLLFRDTTNHAMAMRWPG